MFFNLSFAFALRRPSLTLISDVRLEDGVTLSLELLMLEVGFSEVLLLRGLVSLYSSFVVGS